MGSELIVFFAPVGLAALWYFVAALRPPGKRAFMLVVLWAMALVTYLAIESGGGSGATFCVVAGLVLTAMAVIHISSRVLCAGMRWVRTGSGRT